MAEERKNGTAREEIERAAAEIEKSGFGERPCGRDTLLTTYAVMETTLKTLLKG